MKTIKINSDADFAAFCQTPNAEPVRVEFGINRINLPITGLAIRNRRDIELAGETAPLGRLLLTGGRFSMIGCESVTCRRIGFRSQRPTVPMPPRYEQSWKPFAIHAETPSVPCRNITLRECSFSGHTDEIEAGPADHAWWYQKHIDQPAVIGLTLDRCMIGPSFVNRLADRQFHNFGWAFSLVDDLTLTSCVFVASNRRNPQIAGRNARIAHCVIDDWGTMGIGIHAGSDVEITACHFIRGPHTLGSERPVSLVEGTFQTPVGVSGKVRLSITPNCMEYGPAFMAYRKGWDCWHEPASDQGRTWIKRTAVGAAIIKPLNEIVAAAGCGDSLDQSVRACLMARKHVPWLTDYTTEFSFPLAT